MIFNIGGFNNIKDEMPEFTHSAGNNAYVIYDEGKYNGIQNWAIVFNASGTLRFSKVVKNIDVFVIGGGGAGANTGHDTGNASGGGGYYAVAYNVDVSKNKDYEIVIGSGGYNAGENGGNTTAFNQTGYGGWAATVGDAENYALFKVYGAEGTASNVYWYSSESSEGESIGDGYINVELLYPLREGWHESGRRLIQGKSGWYYISEPSEDDIIEKYYKNGTNGNGGEAIQVFGNANNVVGGQGEESAAIRWGQGGGSQNIIAANGTVIIRNSR